MKHLTKTLTALAFAIMALPAYAQKEAGFKVAVVYQSDKLVITQVAEHSFQHTTYKQTNDFGYVPCNGLVVRHKKQVIIFDTPTNDEGSEALIKWVKDSLDGSINAIIPTHFHDDCLGGLKAFHQHKIPSYAHAKTIALARANQFEVPQNAFSDSLRLPLGNEAIVARYFGEGHTVDNVVGYYAADKIMFGGCLIKAIDASKGFLGDANVSAWSGTVQKVKQAYPQVQVVVPGHGAAGSSELLDYTINLFRAP